MWATQAARSLRLATQATPGAVCVAGPERLRVLEPLLRYATALRLWRGDGGGALPQASAWVLELPGARVTLGLSPEKARGFSGEGAVLHLVAGGDANEDAAFVSTLLAFEPRIDIAQLAARALLPDAQIASALGVLASSGRWGSIWRRARTSIARCRCRRAAGYVASPVGRGAQAGGRRRGAARRRGAVHGAIGAAALPDRAGRRARARPLHLPLARHIKARAGRASTLAVRMFLDPLNAPGAGA